MSSHLDRARMLIDVHRYRDAVPLILDNLACNPVDAESYAVLAQCYLMLNELDSALEHVDRAIHLEPEFAYAFYIRSYVLRELKRTHEAGWAIDEALRLSPSDPDFLSASADLYSLQDRFADALATADRGLMVHPTHLACTCSKAFAQMCQEKNLQAGETLRNGFIHHPDHSKVHATFAWIAYNCGNYRLARKHFLEALRIDPENNWARRGLEEVGLGSLAWSEFAKLDDWPPETNARGIVACIFMALGYGITWHQSWLDAKPPNAFTDSFSIFLCGGLALGVSCGGLLAKITFLFHGFERQRLSTHELRIVAGSWSLIILGFVGLVFANQLQNSTLHDVSRVTFWGSVPLANTQRFRTTEFRRLSAIVLWFYTLTGFCVVISNYLPLLNWGHALIDGLHILVLVSVPIYLWAFSLRETTDPSRRK